jgi:hypothetical protein
MFVRSSAFSLLQGRLAGQQVGPANCKVWGLVCFSAHTRRSGLTCWPKTGGLPPLRCDFAVLLAGGRGELRRERGWLTIEGLVARGIYPILPILISRGMGGERRLSFLSDWPNKTLD